LHAPPLQLVDTTLLVEHACPHAPQLEGVALVSVSHPLLVSPSQLPVPSAHAVQTPLEQVGVAPLQTVSHLPQCKGSELVFTSQPLLCLFPSQSA
jgi:hypothetical protein